MYSVTTQAPALEVATGTVARVCNLRSNSVLVRLPSVLDSLPSTFASAPHAKRDSLCKRSALKHVLQAVTSENGDIHDAHTLLFLG